MSNDSQHDLDEIDARDLHDPLGSLDDGDEWMRTMQNSVDDHAAGDMLDGNALDIDGSLESLGADENPESDFDPMAGDMEVADNYEIPTEDDLIEPHESAQSKTQQAAPKKSSPVIFIGAGLVALSLFGAGAYVMVGKVTGGAPVAAKTQRAEFEDEKAPSHAKAEEPKQLEAAGVAVAPAVPVVPAAPIEGSISQQHVPLPALQSEEPVQPIQGAQSQTVAAVQLPAPSAVAAPVSAPQSSGLDQVIAMQQQAIEELSQKSVDLASKLATVEARIADIDARQASLARVAATTSVRVRLKGVQVIGTSSDNQMLILKLADGTNRAVAVGDSITHDGKKITVTAIDAALKALSFGDRLFADETMEPVAQKTTSPVASKTIKQPRPAPKSNSAEDDDVPANVNVSYQAGKSVTQRQIADGWILSAQFEQDKFLLQDPKGKFTTVRINQTLDGMGKVEGLDGHGNLKIGPYLVKLSK